MIDCVSKEKLKKILDKHLKWWRNEGGGSRADLSRTDLSGVNLSRANLYGADLSRANLYGANLSGANLSRTDLSGANLYGADLSRANLSRADLSGADLSGADLSGANLSRADLSRAKIAIELLNKFYPICCPEYGEFIGWKKARNNMIVKLLICEDAKRSSAYGRKCRCSKAEVVAIENVDGTLSELMEISSRRDTNFVYCVGKIVYVDDFDDDRRNECSTGIHFFITRQEAVDYDG